MELGSIATLRAHAESSSSPGRSVLVLGDRMQVRIGTRAVTLKPTSFKLLSYLIVHQGRWVRADVLREDVIQSHYAPHASNLRWHVLQARRALGDLRHALHSDNRLGFMFAPWGCERPHCRRGR